MMGNDSAPNFTVRVILDESTHSGNVKQRKVHVPNAAMASIQRRFMRTLRRLNTDLSSATGIQKGSSVKDHVAVHTDNRYFYGIDIRNAFPNVSIDRLIDVLERFEIPVSFILAGKHKEEIPSLAVFIREFCAAPEGGLRVGSPSSPDLFNIYCAETLDPAVQRLASLYRLTYTRYGDDMLFSSNERIPPHVRKLIRQKVNAAGFSEADHKAILADLAQEPIFLNGIGLEWRGQEKSARMFVPRDYTRTLRGMILKAMTTLDATLMQKVHGKMGHFKSVTDTDNPNRTEEKLLRLYRSVKRFFHSQAPRKSLPQP